MVLPYGVNPAAFRWPVQGQTVTVTEHGIDEQESIRGLAVASDVRIEAHLLFEEPPSGGQRRLLALGCADEAKREIWLGLLLRQFSGADRRPVLFEQVHPQEVPFELLRSRGFEPGIRTLGYATEPTPG